MVVDMPFFATITWRGSGLKKRVIVGCAAIRLRN